MNPEETILLVDKPKGLTSFGVVARVRRILGVKKAGHAGTLDPLATGLMVVGVGPGTKTLTRLVKLDKEYVAEILIGQRRSTGDMEGEVLEEKEVSAMISRETIAITLNTLLGDIMLPVSAYSAIKVDGVPMYKRARAAEKKGGQAEGVPERAMRVNAAELLIENTIIYSSDKNQFFSDTAWEKFVTEENTTIYDSKKFQLVTVRFAVGSGTYIRSLAEELGRRLGYPATLYNLRRTKVGEFLIEDAVTLESLAAQHGKELF
ncbi:MAG: tRNA pseudouridine synthase [Candidatus Parcubacteria bacterium]|jgi:tRNA pseudouridine55 synthase